MRDGTRGKSALALSQRLLSQTSASSFKFTITTQWPCPTRSPERKNVHWTHLPMGREMEKSTDELRACSRHRHAPSTTHAATAACGGEENAKALCPSLCEEGAGWRGFFWWLRL